MKDLAHIPVLVTGVSGNLGMRLLPQLSGFRVIGCDLRSPAEPPEALASFHPLDLARESSCSELVELLRDYNVQSVVHLAFVIDPVRTGVLDKGRMWQINVAGTARVMEAIAEVNRSGGRVERFIFPSSVSAYGPDLPPMVGEDQPLAAHTLTYAVHKKEADEVVQLRSHQMGRCATFILRPHIFVGATMQNYLVGALRGTPTGTGKLAARLRDRGKRLPLLLPSGEQYPQKRFQFLHVDDMARLIAHILRENATPGSMRVLNVAGRGEPITLARSAEIANAKIKRLPTRALCRSALKILWDLGISAVPPDALPYMIGSYTMRLDALRAYLGKDFEKVIRFTVEEGLKDTFAAEEVTDSQELVAENS